MLEQRVYHVTHVDNLPGILSAGCLLADTAAEPADTAADSAGASLADTAAEPADTAVDSAGASPAVDIAFPRAREARRQLVLEPNRVSDYVPFFLSPDASIWDRLRSGEPDPRLADDASRFAAGEFVVLVTTVESVFDAAADQPSTAIRVSNGDAVGPLTRFATGRDDAERMLRTMRLDEQSPALLDAELLVNASFPFDRISLVGVIGEKARRNVRKMLGDSGYSTKVVVYPPWFRRQQADVG